MCGIAGILSNNHLRVQQNLLLEMGRAIAHRGPDANTLWINNNNTVGLTHQYLAASKNEITLPSLYFLQQYSIVFDGKIDNIIEIKNNLSHYGYYFKTNTTAEIIVAAFDLYKEKCLQFMEGSFAFAIWNEKTQTLFFARDRFGQKPFYYTDNQDDFAFASEIKALWSTGITKSTDERMLLNYLSLGQVQNPTIKSQTFYKNISSLAPAHFGYYSLSTRSLSLHRYWNVNKDFTKQINQADAQSILDQLLYHSINKKLKTSQDFGFQLENNLESAAILLYILDKKQQDQLQLFNAAAIRTNNYGSLLENLSSTEINQENNADNWLTNYEKICFHQDEPFSDSTINQQFNYFSQVNKSGIRTVLDIAGADEIMFGRSEFIPSFLQELIGKYRFLKSKSFYSKFLAHDYQFEWGLKNVWATYLPAHRAIAIEKHSYRSIHSNEDLHPELLSLLKGCEWEGIHQPIITKLNDQAYYTIFDCGLEEKLRYADRNSMANSIELKSPFLDAALIKFMFSLPTKFKMNDGCTKDLLRQLMSKKLPQSLATKNEKPNPPYLPQKNDPTIVDYVYETKKKLVHHHILSPSTIETQKSHSNNSSLSTKDLRYLSAAITLGI